MPSVISISVEAGVDGPPAGDRRVVDDVDVPRRADLLDEVLRHARRDVGPADEEGDVPGVLGEVQRSLTGRVPTADHVHRLPGHGPRLRHRSPVEDAHDRELLELGDAQPPVVHTGRHDRRAGAHRGSVRELYALLVAVGLQPGGPPEEVNSAPNDPGLLEGPEGQVVAADAPREPRVVADERARARLAADRLALDDQGRQPLRGAVHGRCQASGTGADDHDVSQTVSGSSGRDQAEGLHELDVARVRERPWRRGELRTRTGSSGSSSPSPREQTAAASSSAS